MKNDALTRDEQDMLEADGWKYAGGGLGDNGQPYLKFTKHGETSRGSRTYWRDVIANIPRVSPPPTPAEATRDMAHALADAFAAAGLPWTGQHDSHARRALAPFTEELARLRRIAAERGREVELLEDEVQRLKEGRK